MNKIRYEKGLEIFSNHPTNYKCYICPIEDDLSLEEHLQHRTHRHMAKYFSKHFDGAGPSVQCRTCTEFCPLAAGVEHAKNHKLIPWYRPKNEFEILFENFISYSGKKYYCHVCITKCSKWYLAITHIETSAHKSNLKATINGSLTKNINSSETMYKIGVEHAVFREGSNKLFCYLCHCSTNGTHNSLVEHTQSFVHKEKEERWKNDFRVAESYQLSPIQSCTLQSDSSDEITIVRSLCKICNVELNVDEMQRHIALHEKNPYTPVSVGVSGVLETPQVEIIEITSTPEKSIRDTSTKKDVPKQTISDTPIINITEKNASRKKNNCNVKKLNGKLENENALCSAPPSSSTSQKSKDSTEECLIAEEQKLLESASAAGIVELRRNMYKCRLCNYEIIGSEKIQEHLGSYQHQSNDPENLKYTPRKKTCVPSKPKKQLTATYAPSLPRLSSADKPNLSVSNNIPRSLNNTHQQQKKFAASDASNFKEIYFIKCYICNRTFLYDVARISRHEKSREHMDNLRYMRGDEPVLVPCNTVRYFMVPSIDVPSTDLMRIMVASWNNTDDILNVYYWCNICEVSIYEAPNLHMQSEIHLRILHGIVATNDARYLFCTHCKCGIFPTPNDFYNHIDGLTHRIELRNSQGGRESLKVDFRTLQQYFPRKKQPHGIEITTNEDFALCRTCNWRLWSSDEIQTHIKTDSHRWNMAIDSIIEISPSTFACFACLGVYQNLRSLEKHLSGERHYRYCGSLQRFDADRVVDCLLSPIRVDDIKNFRCLSCNIQFGGDIVDALLHTFEEIHQISISNQNH